MAPKKATEGSAGYDLYAYEDTTVTGGEGNKPISTMIAVALPEGTYGRIAIRSGLAVNQHLAVGAGVIDRDYRAEVKVIVYCTLIGHSYTIKKGERFAQLIVEQISTAPAVVVESLPPPQQRHDGFGSTGQGQLTRK